MVHGRTSYGDLCYEFPRIGSETTSYEKCTLTTFPTANHRNNGGNGSISGATSLKIKSSISKPKSGGLSRFFCKSKSFSNLKDLTKGKQVCARALEKHGNTVEHKASVAVRDEAAPEGALLSLRQNAWTPPIVSTQSNRFNHASRSPSFDDCVRLTLMKSIANNETGGNVRINNNKAVELDVKSNGNKVALETISHGRDLEKRSNCQSDDLVVPSMTRSDENSLTVGRESIDNISCLSIDFERLSSSDSYESCMVIT